MADITAFPIPTRVAGTAALADANDFATAAQGELADTALQPGDLALVATSGAYGDLSGLPTLGTMSSESAADYTTTAELGSAAFTASDDYATAAQGSLADTAVQPGDLSTVATSGAYGDLLGLPTLGTMSSESADDYTTTAELGSAAFTSTSAYATSAQGNLADTAVQPGDLSTVATSGAYGDLLGLPTLGTMAVESADDYTLTSELGSAAFTASDDYATAAQGELADTAVQPGDSIAVPHVVVSASKTLALADANTEQQVDAAATLTIPDNATVAFSRGDKVAVLQTGVGAVTVTASTGVTLNGLAGGSATLAGQYAGAVVTKVGTDAWVINGSHEGVA